MSTIKDDFAGIAPIVKVVMMWIATIATNLSNWYVEFARDIVTAVTSIASFVLIIVVIRYHITNREKTKQDMILGRLQIDKLKKDISSEQP